MIQTRRGFLGSTLAVTLGFRGLKTLIAAETDGAVGGASSIGKATAMGDGAVGFGDLVKDPKGVLDLPAGFSYRVISRHGDKMDDGFLVPGNPDGMGAFAGKGDKTILIRNHELIAEDVDKGPFGSDNGLIARVEAGLAYDRGHGKRPCQGGTTTLVVDNKTGNVERQYLSLAGTQYNCAGGVTPWNTWITCEENTDRAGEYLEHDHGYAFEVPATGDGRLIKAEPIKAMGRFRREAVAVDPKTGIVYQTEDVWDGLLYRYLPNVRGKLLAGGKVQALCVRDGKSLDTRNWIDMGGVEVGPRIEVGTSMAVEWVDMENIASPKNDLRYRGAIAGAAKFARNEGIWWGKGEAYFASTEGGHTRTGQIWKYVPSPFEGTDGENEKPGTLALFIEPNNPNVVRNADNLTVSPWGDLVLCEDTLGTNHMVGVRPDGKAYRLARNVANASEFAGSVFSPDGSTLFVNMQASGETFAIRGPWHKSAS